MIHLRGEVSYLSNTLQREQKLASHPDDKSSPRVQVPIYLHAYIGCGLFHH